ncbi:hypothetical protein [Bdellovibrio reynosensis]|uniref:Uncharacterized protein n=1 Tax=Bdellovibrio reynosensis TaxID=2835041 RepID=A0ABY4CGV0_9BACT|nr:hypothetical protein [Bdellovibrio reynosensis]UOF01435.1 hypothetical protein MNR06_00520 [Bdellovibrio reynosensis]
MKLFRTSFWVYAFCFLSFSLWGYSQLQYSGNTSGTTELASKGTYESRQQCGPERLYLENDLAKISPVFLNTRRQLDANHPPQQCVSFIMQNLVPLSARSGLFSQCRDANGASIESPTKGADGGGYYPPCVTEPYVNSVYNALMDVGDCLNIPVKEFLPKLFNESGLHVNALGGGFDGGVGQLTKSALEAVYMHHDGEPENSSSLNWYINEISKSTKDSCKRIVAAKTSYEIEFPVDPNTKQKKVFCFPREDAANNCHKPWSAAHRCSVMAIPQNPLRNVLFTGVFYKSMLRSATGMGFSKGVDILSGKPFKVGDDYKGYIGDGKYVARFRTLGASRADNEVVRQIIVSLGFNGGIKSGKIFLDNYLKQREAKKIALKDSDIDFVNTDTGRWAIVTNMPTFWRGLGSPDPAALDNALNSLKAVGDLGVDYAKAQKHYKDLRPYVQRELKAIEAMQISKADKDKKILEVKIKYDKHRHPLLAAVFAKADQLTLPEYMRIAHANMIVTVPGAGGAPGYLSFIAAKYAQLEKEMGKEVCTAEKYLQF